MQPNSGLEVEELSKTMYEHLGVKRFPVPIRCKDLRFEAQIQGCQLSEAATATAWTEALCCGFRPGSRLLPEARATRSNLASPLAAMIHGTADAALGAP